MKERESKVSGVRGEELRRHLAEVSRTVRLSGTPGEAVAFEYVGNVLSDLGFGVNRYASDALIGYPAWSRLTALGDEPFEIVCNGYSLTPSTPEGGVDGELAFVGSSLLASYGEAARGKIAVCDGIAIEKGSRAAAAIGAIGQIYVNPDHVHEMCVSPVWGTPVPETAGLLPSVPAVGIARADGERLRRLAASGPVTVRLETTPHRAWTEIPTLTADLVGTECDDFVLFSGHVDSWHHGAMDNGSANATQLEVGRILAGRRGELRRGVRLAFWSGHSHGRYAGSAWYGDAFWEQLHRHCVCHVNIDSVGAVGATILDATASMAETYGFAREILRETAGVELDYHRIGRSSDQSFWGHGVPSLFGALSFRPALESDTAVAEIFGGRSLGWWWHTTEDLVDKIDPDNLVRDARVYEATLLGLCRAERIPFDPAAGAREMADALGSYATRAGGVIDLADSAELAATVAGAIDDSAIHSWPVAEANRLTTALCRALIPVNYTANGPFEQDLATDTVPLPGLRDIDRLADLEVGSDDWHFLRTKLRRAQNRIQHGLSEAARLVGA